MSNLSSQVYFAINTKTNRKEKYYIQSYNTNTRIKQTKAPAVEAEPLSLLSLKIKQES